MTTNAMLWQPSPARVAAANITDFARRYLPSTGGAPPDYAALWRWSNDEQRGVLARGMGVRGSSSARAAIARSSTR